MKPSTSIERSEMSYGEQMSENVPQCPTCADSLNERQLVAISMMVAGKPDAQIAQQIGIDRRTLYRWRHDDDDFRSELQRRRRSLCAEASDRLRSLLTPSLDVMEQHLNDRYDRNRFRAASALLRLSNVRQTVQVKDQEAQGEEQP